MKIKFGKLMNMISFFLVIIFVLFVICWESYISEIEEQRIETQAKVISNSLWNLDPESSFEYLKIAAKLSNYKRIAVYAVQEDKPFIEVEGVKLNIIGQGLNYIGLIYACEKSTPIYHDDKIIGVLNIHHFHDTIYVYMYWLLVSLLLWVVIRFFIKTLENKYTLEERVAERTREVAMSEEDLRITLNSIGDGVIATDAKGIITRMNPVAVKLTGWPLEDAQSKPLLDVFNIINYQTGEVCENPIDRVIKNENIVGLEQHTVLLSRDKKRYNISDSGAPIHSPSGDVVGAVLVFRDITEQYNLEEKLRQAEKMQAIGQLSGGVAHDFNNMLGGILGSVELLQSKIPQNLGVQKYINIIIETAEHAANLTQKLLAFSRQQPSEEQVVEIHKVLTDTVDLLENTIDRRIKIVKNFNAEADSVVGDHSQLQNAFLNICINASHAIQADGEITISSSVTGLDKQYCRNSAFEIVPGDYLQIEFTDNGCGINPEDMQKIFEPFFTTKSKEKGTGLGLSAVYGTVQQHLGAVTVYSEPGVGTSFNIYLPLEKTGIRKSCRKIGVIKGVGNILVVDDESAMRFAAKSLLERMGYTVTVSDNGKSGLDTFGAEPEKYDLVLLDMIMPELNGRDCFDEMRKVCPDVRVVVASGFTRENDIKEMKKNGLKGFIKKPYRMAALSHVVNDALRS